MNNKIDKLQALKYAINIDFRKLLKFELYRRKDNRYFRFIVYDGKNYDEIYEYLQNEDNDFKIPPEAKLKIGYMYNISGKGSFIKVRRSDIDVIIAANPYVIKNEKQYFQAFNFNIARWILSNYPNVYLTNLPELNNKNFKAIHYDSIEKLERLSYDSCYRTDNIWILPNKFRSDNIKLTEIPQEIIDSYEIAKDGYQEFVVYEKDSLKGIKMYGFEEKPILEAHYKDVILDNYRAYIKNEDNLWAEFSLSMSTFKSDFIYTNVEINVSEGFSAAYRDDVKIVLHSKQQVQNQNIVYRDGYFGIEDNKGEMLLDYKYDWISSYGNGYEVYSEGKYGLVNYKGEFILECIYDQIIIKNSLSPIFLACKNGLWGILGNHHIYFDFEDETPNEDKYNMAVNMFINSQYRKHTLMNTAVKYIDKKHGIICMNIKIFDKDFKIRKQNLPEEVYNEVTSSYIRALYYLSKSALKVNDKGNILFCYEDKVKWTKYNELLSTITIGENLKGCIYKPTSKGVIVKLENGLFGKMELKDRSLELGKSIECKVISNKKELLLELIEDIK